MPLLAPRCILWSFLVSIFVLFFGNVRLWLCLGLLYLSPFQTSGALIQLVDDVFGLGEKVGVGRYRYHSMVDDDDTQC